MYFKVNLTLFSIHERKKEKEEKRKFALTVVGWLVIKGAWVKVANKSVASEALFSAF
jgi:hypothetical protein